MDKFELAAIIGLILVSKGKNTNDSVVLKGSDKLIKEYFGDRFKGLTVVINGALNSIVTYVTSIRGIVNDREFLVCQELTSKVWYDTRTASFNILTTHKESK